VARLPPAKLGRLFERRTRWRSRDEAYAPLGRFPQVPG